GAGQRYDNRDGRRRPRRGYSELRCCDLSTWPDAFRRTGQGARSRAARSAARRQIGCSGIHHTRDESLHGRTHADSAPSRWQDTAGSGATGNFLARRRRRARTLVDGHWLCGHRAAYRDRPVAHAVRRAGPGDDAGWVWGLSGRHQCPPHGGAGSRLGRGSRDALGLRNADGICRSRRGVDRRRRIAERERISHTALAFSSILGRESSERDVPKNSADCYWRHSTIEAQRYPCIDGSHMVCARCCVERCSIDTPDLFASCAADGHPTWPSVARRRAVPSKLVCLESYWNDRLFHSVSVRGFLEALRPALRPPLQIAHRFVESKRGLAYYTKRPQGLLWRQAEVWDAPIYYLALHGSPGSVASVLDTIGSEKLCDAFRGYDGYNCLVYFGCCSVLR